MKYRYCERCGKQHLQTRSPLCEKCRRLGSKHKCSVDGCEALINEGAKTCLIHRPLQTNTVYTNCRECGVLLSVSSRRGLCQTCASETRILCACGCGRYRRKYSKDGQTREYVSGHNDSNPEQQRRIAICAVCGKPFSAANAKRILCSIECRTKWLTINPPNERKKILMHCAACGIEIFRAPHQIKPNKEYACSKRCQYIIVANKLKGVRSNAKKLALQRDHSKCCICGFDILVDVHHIEAKHLGGDDCQDNLITLCPNHHTMADRGIINAKELKNRISQVA